MSKHTPGPWTVGSELRFDRFGGPTIKAGATVAVVMSGSGHAEANARLIAAAPRMFAVIEKGAVSGDPECIAIVEAVLRRRVN